MIHTIAFSIIILITLLHGCGSSNNNNGNTTIDYRKNFNPSNEPFFPYQWYLSYTENQFSQSGGIDQDANIHILDAWKYTRGKGITVAVIDANFEPSHPDLEPNVSAFYNADFKTSKVTNKTDESSHGLACAGFIAAPPNGIGILGSAPEANLILIAQEFIDDAAGIRAFEYAKDHGAKIISNSWGTNNVSPAIASEMQDIKDQGITIFFASGNENVNLDDSGFNDESEQPSVIGIGSTNEFNKRASYSNYGSSIDLLAPGGEVVGLVGLDDTGDQGSPYVYYQFDNGYEIKLDKDHAFETGTSFSCPLVAGIGALMLSVNPKLTPDQIEEILIETADKIEENDANYNKNGFSLTHGYGKVNAAKAVQKAKSLVQ